VTAAKLTPPPATKAQIAAHKRRLYIMLAIVGVCVLGAGGMMMGYLATHDRRMLYGFAIAILTGFAAQFWMVYRWWQAEKTGK
jgi:hypothetical protein